MATDSNPSRIPLKGILPPLLFLPVLAWAAADDVQLLVKPGDTLIAISQRYLDRPARWPALQTLNKVADEHRLVPGSTLRLPARWLRWSAGTVEVIHVQGEVRDGSGGAIVAGRRLAEGETIDTGEGLLTLRLGSGATVLFPPGSRARLGQLRSVPGTGLERNAIDLERGDAESRVPPLRQSGSRYEIRTPRVITAVRGTRFRVAAEEGASRHEVVEGHVQVAGSRGRVLLDPGQGVRADDGRVGAAEALLPAPDLSSLPAVVERTVQKLSVPALSGAVAWRWQVAADPEFTRVLRDARTAKPEWLLLGLPDGDYQLRLRAVAADGLEGLDAVRPFTLRARPEPPLVRAPANGGSVAGAPQLAWTQAEGAATVDLQLARDEDFRDLVAERQGLAATGLALEAALPPGEYRWRLASRRADGYRGPYGDAAAFRQLAPTEVAPPSLDGDELRLSWSGPAELTYQVQLARDEAFSREVRDFDAAGTQLRLPRPGAGDYYVRTRPRLDGGETAPWSAAQRFEVPGGHWWLLLLLLPLL